MRETVDRKPPADQRCQIYIPQADAPERGLFRCVNRGTHWVKWGGCRCPDPDSELCVEDFYTWECDNAHETVEAVAC